MGFASVEEDVILRLGVEDLELRVLMCLNG